MASISKFAGIRSAILIVAVLTAGLATGVGSIEPAAAAADADAAENPNLIIRKRVAPGEAPSFEVVDFTPNAAMSAASDPSVIGIELETVMQLMWQPTDPHYSAQWEHRLTGLETAWNTTRGDSSIVIAVLDTGVDPGPEFGDRLLAGASFTGADPLDDIHGHGTSVAAVAAAEADNDVGGVGVCSACTILPVQVGTAGGQIYSLAATNGIIWATDQGADIINMSFGGYTPSNLIKVAIDYAVANGVVVIAAAGNNGTDRLVYPANFDGVLSVGAHDSGFERYSWSTWGPWVDVAAPGCALGINNGDPAIVCGTSFASPWTAGVAGLLLAVAESLTPADVKVLVEGASVETDWVRTGYIDPSHLLQSGSATLDPVGPRLKLGEIELAGDYSGNLTSIQLLVDGIVSAEDLSPVDGRFHLMWDAATAQPGEHVLRVDAVDLSGVALPGTTVSIELYRSVHFDDVVAESFYETAVVWMSDNLITSGTTATTYSPDDPVTRAQIATFLWRYDGQPSVAANGTFEDTAADTWYTSAVDWMVATNLTTGTSPTTFSPDDPVTRAQVAAFLWRYADRPTVDDAAPFADTDPSSWYNAAVDWLVANEITTGTSSTTFSPDDPVTRAQLATFLWRYAGRPTP